MTTFSSQCLTESFTVESWKFNRTIMIAFQGLRRKNKMPKPSRQRRQGKRDLKKNNSGVFLTFYGRCDLALRFAILTRNRKGYIRELPFSVKPQAWPVYDASILFLLVTTGEKCTKCEMYTQKHWWWFPLFKGACSFCFFPLPPFQFKPFV